MDASTTGNQWGPEVTELSVDRFERRLSQEVSALRIEMMGGFGDLRQEMAAVRQEMATTRLELLKWSFAFWVGQVVVVAAILGLFLRRV